MFTWRLADTSYSKEGQAGRRSLFHTTAPAACDVPNGLRFEAAFTWSRLSPSKAQGKVTATRAVFTHLTLATARGTLPRYRADSSLPQNTSFADDLLLLKAALNSRTASKL
ncbi:hypothetical protein BaRGS_00025406 [Batillaria attramentaria]|uniref:Uncharacterized protein n=1 Tax=Batillaria attramentaria TaxID=370345 RepID=A0ABD0K8E1_9CAEN